jgi:hypothetical protein
MAFLAWLAANHKEELAQRKQEENARVVLRHQVKQLDAMLAMRRSGASLENLRKEAKVADIAPPFLAEEIGKDHKIAVLYRWMAHILLLAVVGWTVANVTLSRNLFPLHRLSRVWAK